MCAGDLGILVTVWEEIVWVGKCGILGGVEGRVEGKRSDKYLKTENAQK